MSWLFGFFGTLPKPLPAFSSLQGAPLVQVNTHRLSLTAGGIPETCVQGTFTPPYRDHGFTGWLVVGLGIRRNATPRRFLSSDDWMAVLAEPEPDIAGLEGHFVALRWSDTRLEAYTDLFGLRTFFLAKMPNGVAFSTRPDWLARFSGFTEIDFEQFGSHWLTFNQFSHESLIKGLTRLGPAGRARCTPETVAVEGADWLPDMRPRTPEEVVGLIASLANPLLEPPQRLMMGLSGGLDSRVLLAVLQERKLQPFSLFLFGHPGEPDVQIAMRIAQEERLEQQFFSELTPPPANTIDFLREFVLQTQLTSPASLWRKLRFYSALRADNAVVIDGAFGEIARRQFMNRALKRARSLLRNAGTDRLLPYLATHRANIFTDAIHHRMVRGVALQLAKAWERMPRIQDIGAEMFADLLIVRYRYPNYAGWGQASMDHEIVSYMPFIQPSYVDAAFALPMQLKRNGSFYRHIIRTCRPALARFPLVKGTTTYPFWMTTVPAWAFTKLKTALGRSFNDPLPVLLLEQMKEFVLDTVASSSVRTYDAYDHRRIASHVERFYRGEAGLAREVDWWLSFELWRQGCAGQRT